MLDDDTILKQSWEWLRAGASDRVHPMHLGVLATLADGRPEARTIVLRRAEPEYRAIHVHTDVRAPKVIEIQACPAVSLVFYHPEDRVQLRVRAEVSIHHRDLIAEDAWHHSALIARAGYLGEHAPSSGLDGDVIPDPPPEPPTLTSEECEPGFDNFAVLRCVVSELDWLRLHPSEHQRVLFQFIDEKWKMRRLQP